MSMINKIKVNGVSYNVNEFKYCDETDSNARQVGEYTYFDEYEQQNVTLPVFEKTFIGGWQPINQTSGKTGILTYIAQHNISMGYSNMGILDIVYKYFQIKNGWPLTPSVLPENIKLLYFNWDNDTQQYIIKCDELEILGITEEVTDLEGRVVVTLRYIELPE